VPYLPPHRKASETLGEMMINIFYHKTISISLYTPTPIRMITPIFTSRIIFAILTAFSITTSPNISLARCGLSAIF